MEKNHQGRTESVSDQGRKSAVGEMNMELYSVRPGWARCAHFKETFPVELTCNEWGFKWPIVGQRWKTYNPDFWCESAQDYVECCTSYNNYLGSPAWRYVLKKGWPLRVFWWEGHEITDIVKGGYSLRPDDFPLTDKQREVRETIAAFKASQLP